MFWTNTGSNGQIKIYVNNQYRGTITQYYTSAPNCGASGCVTITVTQQNNTWYGEQVGGSGYWSGSFTLQQGCNTINLY
jgi:hypothetical protein